MSRQKASTQKKEQEEEKKERKWAPSSISWSEKAASGVLGVVADVAEILDVPPSWVYSHANQIPGLVRVGKYLRFRLCDVLAWRNGGGER